MNNLLPKSHQDNKPGKLREVTFSFLYKKERVYMFLAYLAFNLKLYFSLSKKQRRMIQRISLGDNPNKCQIAAYARCDMRSVCSFFQEASNPESNIALFLTVKKDFNQISGWQLKNKITLDKGFLFALRWLESFGYLNSPNFKVEKILNHAKTAQQPAVISHGRISSPPKDLIQPPRKETKKERKPPSVWINPIVKMRGLDQEARIFASRHASDYEIVEALEACRWQEKRKKIDNPSSYFMGVLKNKMQKLEKK